MYIQKISDEEVRLDTIKAGNCFIDANCKVYIVLEPRSDLVCTDAKKRDGILCANLQTGATFIFDSDYTVVSIPPQNIKIVLEERIYSTWE